MDEKNVKKRAYEAALCQVAIIGLSLIFVKLALGALNPLELLAQRFTLAAAYIGLLVLLGKGPKTLSWQRALKILPLALFYPIGFFALQTYAMVFAKASEAGVITAIAPIFTVILARIFLREKVNWKQGVMIGLASLGLFILTTLNSQSSNFSIKGTILLLFSALSMSIYLILVRKLSREYSYLEITTVVLLAGGICFLILISWKQGILSFIQTFRFWKDPKIASSLLYLGILSSYFTSLLNNYALTYLDATKVAILNNLTPIITSLAGSIFLKESFGLGHALAMGLTLLGVLGLHYFQDKSPNPSSKKRKN